MRKVENDAVTRPETPSVHCCHQVSVQVFSTSCVRLLLNLQTMSHAVLIISLCYTRTARHQILKNLMVILRSEFYLGRRPVAACRRGMPWTVPDFSTVPVVVLSDHCLGVRMYIVRMYITPKISGCGGAARCGRHVGHWIAHSADWVAHCM